LPWRTIEERQTLRLSWRRRNGSARSSYWRGGRFVVGLQHDDIWLGLRCRCWCGCCRCRLPRRCLRSLEDRMIELTQRPNETQSRTESQHNGNCGKYQDQCATPSGRLLIGAIPLSIDRLLSSLLHCLLKLGDRTFKGNHPRLRVDRDDWVGHSFFGMLAHGSEIPAQKISNGPSVPGHEINLVSGGAKASTQLQAVVKPLIDRVCRPVPLSVLR
jgi:hypothetical protein